MNRRMVFYTIGRILASEALLLILPLAVSLIYGEDSYKAFAVTIVIAAVLGLFLALVFKPRDNVIYAKEGFATVALTWIALSAIGALPFVLSGEIPSYVNAFFETVSGFTTTGASIVTDFSKMSRGILFWRSFTHWIGGMGVLVFVMAIVPNISDRSIHLMRAEMPGPIVGKLVPRVKDTAKILYLIYIALTAIEVVFLLFGGMSLYESLVYTFGTAGTGGFGIVSESVGAYSPYIQWVIAAFMLLFGVNFNLYYLLLIRHFKNVLKSAELWVYLGIVTVSVITITANISRTLGLEDSFRHAFFQVSSIMTTTGYATVNFDMWPELSKGILLILMFIGGCAGSTAGGLKVSRVIIMFKMVRKELTHMLHPRSVSAIKFEGKPVSEQTQRNILLYFVLYIACLLAVFLLISVDPFDITTNFSAAVACFNNVGPGFGHVGPAASYADYSSFSKLVLSFAMLLGRLEIFPLILACSPATWVRK